ncbi:MAG: sulfatase-like hydrolase/transferase [Firmicutes bacterium]|nr:sulfatase-like hydrolase/transferase [Bacillota bacterium]
MLNRDKRTTVPQRSAASRASSETQRSSASSQRISQSTSVRSSAERTGRTARTESSAGRTSSSNRRSRKKGGYASLFILPAYIVWLELVLHIFMGNEIKYAPIYILHGIMYGCIFTFISKLFPKKVSLIISKVLAGLTGLVFCIEFVAKNILQDYYPASMIKTGADNHLMDYIGAIVAFLLRKFYVIILFLAPVILAIIFIKMPLKCRIKKRGVVIISLVAAILFFFLGKLFITIPFKGNMTPKELYNMDGQYNDQVEQLGLINMLRLDIKHMIWPAESHIDVPDDPLPVDPVDPAPDQAKFEPNMINLDFAAIQKDSSSSNVKNLAQYFSTVQPTRQNEYTGMFKGYNVVFFTVEGFSGYAIDPVLTPTLYKITHEGFVFNNFYTALHFTSTSNGECQNLLSLYPKNGFPITMSRTGDLKTNAYFSLAQQLKREGYVNWGYHNNIDMYNRAASHSNLGYNWRYIHYNGSYSKYNDCIDYEGSGGENKGKLRWMQRDTYMVEHTWDDYINSDKPFNVYYMTITGHTPYTYTSWAFGKSGSNWIEDERVKALKYTDKTKAYIMAAMEMDKAAEMLINKLQEVGKLDKTVIVVVPDHIPYFDVDSLEEITGKKFGSSKDFEAINERNIDFEVYHSALAIWSPSIKETKQIDKVCCQVDILPTLSNLLGLEYDSRMLAGTDILSSSEGLVVFSSNCWKSDKGFYNSFTKKFTLNEGITMSESAQETYVNYMTKVAKNRREITNMIVESNFYNVALGTKKYIREKSDEPSDGGFTREELENMFREFYNQRLLMEFKDPPEIKKENVGPFA